MGTTLRNLAISHCSIFGSPDGNVFSQLSCFSGTTACHLASAFRRETHRSLGESGWRLDGPAHFATRLERKRPENRRTRDP